MAGDSAKNESDGGLVVFGAKQIRRLWYEGQWQFSVVDIVGVLTDSPNPRNYWNMMKAREAAIEGGSVAGNARRELEHKSGKPVVTARNFLSASRKRKALPPEEGMAK